MKKLLFWMGIMVIVVACSTQKRITKTDARTIEVETDDSLEYELETFDSEFESWYLLHNGPAEYRSKSYYEYWNRQYVSAWNANAMQHDRKSFFEPIVGYDPTIDYGFELNHKLFYYFQYVENILKISIMPGGPKSIRM